MKLKCVSKEDLPILNKLLDEMKIITQKIEEISRGDHKELTEDSIEESLIEMTKSMELDISDLEKELFESVAVTQQKGISSLLDIPEELRKTAKAVLKLGKASTEDIKVHTKQMLEVEENCIKRLIDLGYLAKRIEGGTTYYMPSLGRRKKSLPEDIYNTLQTNTTDLEKAIFKLPTSKERTVVKRILNDYLVRIRNLTQE